MLNTDRRRVLRSLKIIGEGMLLGSDAMFASNKMDGSVKVINTASLL